MNEVSVSPDGRWIAYTGIVDARLTLWIQAFPGAGQRIRVEVSPPEDAALIDIIPHRWLDDSSGLFYSIWTVESAQMWTSRVEPAPLRAHSAQMVFDSIPAAFVVANVGRSVGVHPNGDEVAWIEREGFHKVVLIQGWEAMIARADGGGR